MDPKIVTQSANIEAGEFFLYNLSKNFSACLNLII